MEGLLFNSSDRTLLDILEPDVLVHVGWPCAALPSSPDSNRDGGQTLIKGEMTEGRADSQHPNSNPTKLQSN